MMFENRPLCITTVAPPCNTAGTKTTFVYDGDGGRVKKIEGTLTTIYIGKLYECSGTTAPYPCVKYIFAGGQRIAMKQVSNGVVDYFHPDHLGSTSVMTTATGTKEEDLAYYPYGGTRINTGTVNVPYKYTGKELDASTGLYFYEARYYDATLGRFISADTIVQNPHDPQALNRYSYVRNNPLRYVDPSGHFIQLVLDALGLGNYARAADAAVTTAAVSQSQAHGRYVVENAVLAYHGLPTSLNKIRAVRQGVRYYVAGSIIVGSAATTFACGGCGAIAGVAISKIAAGALVGSTSFGALGGL
jgi:RHS repeat-associated protein